MAPPHKRRRLADSPSSPSFSDITLSEPSPTLSHAVEELKHRPSLARIPRPVPQRIEEVHLQIQKKSVADYHDYRRRGLELRQDLGTAVSSALDSTLTVTVLQWADFTGGVALSTINDDLGGTYGTTQTLTLVSSPLSSATSEPSSTNASTTEPSDGTPSNSPSPSDGFIGNSPSSGTGASSAQTASSGTGSSGSLPSPSSGVSPASVTGSSSANSTRTDTTQSSNSSGSDSSTASLGPGLFLATLSNGDEVTLTRSDEPYTTTFGDGRVSTIAPLRSSDTDRSSESNTRTSVDSSESDESSQQRSTQTSINVVTEPNQTQNAPGTPTAASIASTSPASGGGGGDSAPAGTIAGGVVGGCAGIAVILLVALVLLRWWKRKAQNGHHALPPSSEYTPDPDAMSPSLRGQPGMAERAGLRPLVGAVPAFFRHSNRSSEPSVPPSERGFTRVSGRKLPSQFSAGMSSAQPAGPPPSMPLRAPGARSPDPADAEHERNLSSHSFYRDSEGFYGGQGVQHSPSPSESLENPTAMTGRGPTPEEIALSPGPQRTPTVHRGGPYTMSPSSTVPSTPGLPMQSPTLPTFSPGAGGMERSETPTSADNRSSRFTEEV